MTEFAAMLSAAGLTNFHPTTVGRLERGERPVRLSEAVVIAKVLGSNLDDLVVEPLVGDDELRHAMEAVESMSKRAARCLDTIEYWKGQVQSGITDLEQQLSQGKILDENVSKVKQACEEAAALLEEDRVRHWMGLLAGLNKEGQQALYKSDPDFRIS